MKNFITALGELVVIAVVVIFLMVTIRMFIFQPFLVRGHSMEPSYHDGDYLIVDELSYRFRDPQRGEVIVFVSPNNPSERLIKRVVALPNETVEIEDGVITVQEVDGTTMTLNEDYLPSSVHTSGDVEVALENDEYFVLGDNREFSYDSRRWGTLDEDLIIGKVLLRLLPVQAFAYMETPSYSN